MARILLGKIKKLVVRQKRRVATEEELRWKRSRNISNHNENIGDESSHDGRRGEKLKRATRLIVGKELVRIKHAFGNKA